ncbi:MAG: NAD(P)-dependent oxidoreductase [Bacteroidetes bacterium]|nr:NAD(P)-dependent oxidoreductase [Bacteroidota bacterium]
MSKILVTGGAGFIGSAVIKHLQQAQHEIFVIDNLSFGNRDFIQVNDTHFFKHDILDRATVIELFTKIKPDIVLHLAAIHFIPYCNAHPHESANINIQGTINVLDAAHIAGVKQLLFASTAAVYPISDEAVSETNATGPMDIYGLSKLAGEHLCNEFFLQSGINTIVCRFFNAFGPNETNPHLIPEIEKQIKEGTRTIKLGNLTPKRDFIHTYDMASAMEIILAKLNEGLHVINLGRGIEYSVVEIVEAFEKNLGEKITIEVEEARVRKVERMHLLADVSKLKSLGWEPKISIEEGTKTLLQNN